MSKQCHGCKRTRTDKEGGAYCPQCRADLRRRHAEWERENGPPRLNPDEPARPQANPRPGAVLSLDEADPDSDGPTEADRLAMGFSLMEGRPWL